jgi:UDP-glucose 4-epimerase
MKGMMVLVTGSEGHLGEALMRRLPEEGYEVRGLDIRPGPFTDVVGTVTDRLTVRSALEGVGAVLHTATLHKPHVGTHNREAFVETNITGTLVLLEEAVAAGVGAFVFTSTTSTFGRALTPGTGDPAAWITEDVVPQPRNVYGVTKVAAEDLCELIHRDHGLPCLILRTSRFFLEPDDAEDRRTTYEDLNLKVCELLYRRVDLEDTVTAHLRAIDRAAEIGFGRYLVTATTPFELGDLPDLRGKAPAVVARRHPDYERVFADRGWSMLRDIERVYVNDRARSDLGWEPRHTFGAAICALADGQDPFSQIARTVGAKGYHDQSVGVYTQR